MRLSKWDWMAYHMAECQLEGEIAEVRYRYLIDDEQLRVILRYARRHLETGLREAYLILYGPRPESEE